MVQFDIDGFIYNWLWSYGCAAWWIIVNVKLSSVLIREEEHNLNECYFLTYR